MLGDKRVKKLIGPRVCPKSSPLFQEFRIWQFLNNLTIDDDRVELEVKEKLYEELRVKEKLSQKDISKYAYGLIDDGLNIKYKEIIGNKTFVTLIKACPRIKNDSSFVFDSSKDLDNQKIYKLWHLLYSYEDDNSKSGVDKLLKKLQKEPFNFTIDEAKALSRISFEDDYSNLSAKAIRKLLPYMKQGKLYSEACLLAGYVTHSKQSLTKEEIENKVLQKHLSPLKKNSLRNPVVEKILNQMINVVNELVDTYADGHFDEIRIELARELKMNSEKRKNMTKSIDDANKENERIRQILREEFKFSHIGRNDIVRYKLYEELKNNGYKTLYSNEKISKEDIFSYDIEHIIPQLVRFDDSFANKTLELGGVNRDKGSETAYDFVKRKYNLEEYKSRVKNLFNTGAISRTKYKNLMTSFDSIDEGFIERDIKDSQYIAKKAKEMLLTITKNVVSTTGSVTSRLREDWQLVDVMRDLNWDKYDKLGLTHKEKTRDGNVVKKIDDWTKRNDHRHHAMDAITIAFTKHSFIQYLNFLNARTDKQGNNIEKKEYDKGEKEFNNLKLKDLNKKERRYVIYAIENKDLHRDKHDKLVFNSPIPLNEFRRQAKESLENIIVSIKAKNKVATKNANTIKSSHGTIKQIQLTPRGTLHKETICSQMRVPVIKTKKITGSFTKEEILKVCNKDYREALLKRLEEFYGDSKKAFSCKNSLENHPIYYEQGLSKKVPLEVKILDGYDTIYTVRRSIDKNLAIDKVIDKHIREILQERLKEYGNDSGKAFSNLEENPIYLNKEKGITIKKVRVKHLNNALALHSKKDKNGTLILDNNGNTQPVDFVDTGSNHHIAIYQDEKGEWQEKVVSFFEATARKLNDMPIVDKYYKTEEGWKFLFSMKINEFFLFPDDKGFNPSELSKEYIMNQDNYNVLSPHLYRVQKLSTKNYVFRHHLETTIDDNPNLRNVTWKRIQTPSNLKDVVKIRVNHIGRIVVIGEY